MTNQQLDAIYIRKQLEDINKNNDANTTPGERKQGGGPKDTPSKKRGRDRINLLATTMHEEVKNEKSSPAGSKPFRGKIQETILCIRKMFWTCNSFLSQWNI